MAGMEENSATTQTPYDFIPSALVIEDVTGGSAARADRGDDILVHYVGRLLDGRDGSCPAPQR